MKNMNLGGGGDAECGIGCVCTNTMFDKSLESESRSPYNNGLVNSPATAKST